MYLIFFAVAYSSSAINDVRRSNSTKILPKQNVFPKFTKCYLYSVKINK